MSSYPGVLSVCVSGCLLLSVAVAGIIDGHVLVLLRLSPCVCLLVSVSVCLIVSQVKLLMTITYPRVLVLSVFVSSVHFVIGKIEPSFHFLYPFPSLFFLCVYVKVWKLLKARHPSVSVSTSVYVRSAWWTACHFAFMCLRLCFLCAFLCHSSLRNGYKRVIFPSLYSHPSPFSLNGE